MGFQPEIFTNILIKKYESQNCVHNKIYRFPYFLYYTFQQHLYKPYSAMSTLIPGSNNIIPIMFVGRKGCIQWAGMYYTASLVRKKLLSGPVNITYRSRRLMMRFNSLTKE